MRSAVLAGKTAGVVGCGRIGKIVARLLWHLRCNVLAYDLHEDEPLKELGVKFASLEDVLTQSHIITLNCPLTKDTKHLIGKESIPKLKKGVMIVNTGRGALVDSQGAIEV
jgi:D-lactate dehydrogenase